jgi:hypothetical protein
MKVLVVILSCISLLCCRKSDFPAQIFKAKLYLSSGNSFEARFIDGQVTVIKSKETYGESLSICGSKSGEYYLCVRIVNPHVGSFFLSEGDAANYVYYGSASTSSQFFYTTLYGGYGNLEIEVLNDKLLRGHFYADLPGANAGEMVNVKGAYFDVKMK